MKKIKWLMLLAVLIATTAAFSRKAFDCYNMPQYYKIGFDNYQPAGTFGIDFYCQYSLANTCTYYYDVWSQQYFPCRTGYYTPILGKK